MPTPPASPRPNPPAHRELQALAAAIAAAATRARCGEFASLADLADRVERLCAGLTVAGDLDWLRGQLVGLADELEALLRALEQGREELVGELARGNMRLAASRAYAPSDDPSS